MKKFEAVTNLHFGQHYLPPKPLVFGFGGALTLPFCLRRRCRKCSCRSMSESPTWATSLMNASSLLPPAAPLVTLPGPTPCISAAVF